MLKKSIFSLCSFFLVATSLCRPFPPGLEERDSTPVQSYRDSWSDDWDHYPIAHNWPLPCDPCDPWGHEDQIRAKIQGSLVELQCYVQEKELDVNETFSCLRNTMLIMAINADRLDVVRWLISMGVRINTGNFNKETPLHKAVSKNNEAILRFLLEQENIAINQPNDDGYTPLMLSVEQNYVNIAHILKQAGAEEPCCPVCLEELTDLYRSSKSLRRACTNSEYHRLCTSCYSDVKLHAVGEPRCPLCRAALL